MMKKLLSGILIVIFVVFLCGCDFFTTDTAELLSPPALSDELANISSAIDESVDGTYTLKYPQSGEYRSAVIQKDIDGNGLSEAFAFYSVKNGDTETMNINVVVKDKEKWKSVDSQGIVASGVQRVEFCDLDGDGISEILVGWQIYGTSEMQLAVYSFKENVLTRHILKKYTRFVTCNLDDNNTNEIMIIDTDNETAQNTASLYGMNESGVILFGKCKLDGKSQSFGQPKVSELSSGKTAVYLDSLKGIGAVTEVLIYEKGKLLNPLFDEQTQEAVATLRSSSFATRDFNGDGILEIPVQLDVPAVSESGTAEKIYLTQWCSFNGEILTPQTTSMINTIDGYYYNLPAKWVGNIAVLKDTDSRIREIYYYNTQEMSVGKSLLYLRAVSKKDWRNGIYNALNLIKLGETANSVIACRISKEAKENGLTIEQVKADFEIYTKE